jgi:hypothetical protein
MKGLWLGLVLLHPGLRFAPWGPQGGAAPASVVFSLDRPAARMMYRFTLLEDGSGEYEATYPATPPATPSETVKTPLRLHAGTAKKIFEQARATVPLHGNCETKARNIAQTGVKTLTFSGGEGSATCTWNYSEKSNVSALQDEFGAMALTLDEARKLQMEQRFDRLGLDREMGYLLEQAKAGQAQGLENIAPVLQAIVADESLLERVRVRAKTLLQMSEAGQ